MNLTTVPVTELVADDKVVLNEEVFVVVKTGRGLKERNVTYRRPGARSDDTFTITHLATSVAQRLEP